MKTPGEQEKTTLYADRQRLRQLANKPALFDDEVKELESLAVRLGVKVKMERVDLTTWGQASAYEIG